MRHALSGARALLLTLAFLTTAAPAASTSPADRPLEKGMPGDPEGSLIGRLVDDDAYLRHGAITSMATCLTIADDVPATLLWAKGLPRRPAADHALAAWLRGEGSPAVHTPGFGTLLACAQIVAAWHGSLPDRRMISEVDDGRIKHGAVVIDLATAAGEASAIAPEPLVRLLTSRGLLPPPRR